MQGASASELIAHYLQLLRRVPVAPEVAASVLTEVLPVLQPRPRALILAPHPDDECLTGALPLRFRQELGWQIISVAVTLGSNKEKRAIRQAELAKACAVLEFDGVLPQENGFDAVTAQTRRDNPEAWLKMVARLAAIIAHCCKPRAIFLPHAEDLHPSHIGTYWLGVDALAQMPNDFSCAVIQTEYWQPIADPNLMIGVSEKDAATLLAALACHAGENARNSFDARFPAYLIDNVRRGSERVGGKGAASAAMDFAMLYKFGLWKNGKFIPSALKRIIGAAENLQPLFD